MTVADAVGMAKSGPDKVAKFRRMELKRASDADVARQHAEAKATENAALDAKRLAAAAVIQAAVLRWATRRKIEVGWMTKSSARARVCVCVCARAHARAARVSILLPRARACVCVCVCVCVSILLPSRVPPLLPPTLDMSLHFLRVLSVTQKHKAAMALQAQFRTLHAMHKVKTILDITAKADASKKTAKSTRAKAPIISKIIEKVVPKAAAQQPKPTTTTTTTTDVPTPAEEPATAEGAAAAAASVASSARPRSVETPGYLLKPENAGIEYVLEAELDAEGRPVVPVGLEVSYKKANFLGRGTIAVRGH
jgi:hypothetical protein